MSDDRIRVFVVDDHIVVRRGITALFDMLDGICVVGEASDGHEALAAIDALSAAGTPPRVVLMDLKMPVLDGIETTRSLRERYPDINVIVLTSFGEPDRVRSALSAGAAGYVLKDADVDEIAAAIRAADRGEIHLDAALTRELAKAPALDQRSISALTARERDVLELLAQGRSNQQIATTLVISERTARTHVSNILAKLAFASRTQAALWAVEQGIVESHP